MKDYIKGIKNGLGIMTVMMSGYFVVLATWQGNYGLEVSGEEVLTADKWNTLVQSLGGVKMKVFEGNLDNDSRTDIPHGLALADILYVACNVHDKGASEVSNAYRPMSYITSNARMALFDSTNIIITIDGAVGSFGGEPYNCVLFYK